MPELQRVCALHIESCSEQCSKLEFCSAKAKGSLNGSHLHKIEISMFLF